MNQSNEDTDRVNQSVLPPIDKKHMNANQVSPSPPENDIIMSEGG
jgi:hypothetical protein